MENKENKKEKFKEYLVRRISSKEKYEELLNFPRYIEIETINACNARCPMCTITNWKRNAKPMADEMFEKIASELSRHADIIKRASLYRDGEPLLDKKLAARIARLKKEGIKSVAISTNASLLSETSSKEILNAGIDLVIISIDSLKKEIYESIRKGLKFEVVLNNILNFIKLRNEIRPEAKIWIRAIRQESNYNEWPEFEKYWLEKVSKHDRVYFHYIFNWGGQLENFKPVNESYEPNLPCVALWSLMVIFSNGDVPLCNVDFKNKYPVGNIMKNTIEELWKSKILNEKRELHLNCSKSRIDICEKCNVWDEPKDKEAISSEYAEMVKIKD